MLPNSSVSTLLSEPVIMSSPVIQSPQIVSQTFQMPESSTVLRTAPGKSSSDQKSKKLFFGKFHLSSVDVGKLKTIRKICNFIFS
jgi:hypothetical protein